jgi:hypothetical protein
LKSFSEYLAEAKKTTAAFTFGRFQPPTIGHEKLLGAVKREARGGEYFVFVSQTTGNKDNPIEFSEKLTFMREMFPMYNEHLCEETQVKTILDAVKLLESRGFKNLRLVVGSDRVEHFRELLEKYNGDLYVMESIEVISAGDRDPDGEEVEGMSGSKIRAAARSGDRAAFDKGFPRTLSEESRERMFKILAETIKPRKEIK